MSRIESTHTIDIESFVPRGEIDEVYLDAPYYIAPDGNVAEEAFAVIRDAMREKDVVGLGRVVLYRRERIVMLEPRGKGIVARTLRYAYEVRDDDEYFDDIGEVKIVARDARTRRAHHRQEACAFRPAGNSRTAIRRRLSTLIKAKTGHGPAPKLERAETVQRHQPDGCSAKKHRRRKEAQLRRGPAAPRAAQARASRKSSTSAGKAGTKRPAKAAQKSAKAKAPAKTRFGAEVLAQERPADRPIALTCARAWR